MQVPTDRGDVWFKANTEDLRHEAAIVDILAVCATELVPPLLARDTSSGWMLMDDAGETLRSVIERERRLDRWLDVLPRYAALQLEHVDPVDDFLAAGVPDMRLATLPERYDRLVRELEVEQRFRDAHAVRRGAVRSARGARHRGDHPARRPARRAGVRPRRPTPGDGLGRRVRHTPVPHPVGDARGRDRVGSGGHREIGRRRACRDAYLAPFAEAYGDDLVSAVEAALRLGWVCRAVNGYFPDDGRGLSTRLRMFLDGTA